MIRERDLLYMVFEFLDLNLYEVSKNRSKPFSEVSLSAPEATQPSAPFKSRIPLL